ncbi:MCE family protein [Mycolicibacterium nivoides]|uniref:MCE family protein n=1 Tax=Mycolicibacterium nivoides TaxID=2487344 RepID=UPI003C30C4A6
MVMLTATTLSACSWKGLNTLQLPGAEGTGDGAYTIQAQLPDVTNIQPNSRVRVGDVNVGTVTKVERQDWHALLTIRLNGDVDLPANALVTIGQTSLLGSLHIELGPPKNGAPNGKLHEGSLIPLANGSAYPSTEQTLAATSMLLNGGGIGEMQDITVALTTAFGGPRQDQLRLLLDQLRTFTARLNEQTQDIIDATVAINRVAGQFATQRPVFDRALDTLPRALKVLNDERDALVDAVDELGRFSELAADSVNQTRTAIVSELKNLGPVLKSLADSGPALTRSLGLLSTFPFPKDTLPNWFRGDYANISLVVDLTLSRLDSALFTGTRWEGDLTELEIQWGRTIGQLPSPYTAANPLLAPYRFDQGR